MVSLAVHDVSRRFAVEAPGEPVVSPAGVIAVQVGRRATLRGPSVDPRPFRARQSRVDKCCARRVRDLVRSLIRLRRLRVAVLWSQLVRVPSHIRLTIREPGSSRSVARPTPPRDRRSCARGNRAPRRSPGMACRARTSCGLRRPIAQWRRRQPARNNLRVASRAHAPGPYRGEHGTDSLAGPRGMPHGPALLVPQSIVNGLLAPPSTP